MSNQNDMRQFSLKLAERENEYMTVNNYRVFCGTFNVNGKSPDEDLRSWLLVNNTKTDVYAIGFQEVVDLSTTSYLLQSDWLEREQRWIQAIDSELCTSNDNHFNNFKSFLSKDKKTIQYRRIVKYRMFGLLILIYVDEKIDHTCVSEIFTAEVPTGIMDTLGNKGSVGVSLKLNETRLCFVCSHFASDTSQLQRRNADFRSTRQRMKFHYNANLDYYDQDGHDAVFWFGDLNYRLDKISLNKTIEQIYTNEIDKLIEFDQLTIEMNKLNVFENFNEGKINFRPTYKYIVKQDIYEKQLAQKAAIQNNDINQINDHGNDNFKVKLPSWTDRILWKAINTKVNLVQYSCINTITISDHKPVYALFDIDVKKINEKAFNKIYDSLLKDSDRKLNDEMPRISIEKYDYKFQECRFYDQKSLQLIVKNDGLTRSNVDVQFYDPNLTSDKEFDFTTDELSSEIKNQNNRSNQQKMNQWCAINPRHKERIEPGASYKIEIITNFNINVLSRFNKNPMVDDFLILRCLNGNDIFVTLSVEYKPTIIGFSLKTLSAIGKSFDQCNFKELMETHEVQLEKFESNINSMWLHSLKFLSAEMEKKKAEKLFENLNMDKSTKSKLAANSSTKPSKTKFYSESTAELTFDSPSDSKIELYKTVLLNLKSEIIDKDEYFNNDLSSEYTFFIQNLIDRCSANIENLDSSESSSKNSSFIVEDRKNLALTLLSSKNFEKFREENFDMELLVEVLYDLLYALPNAAIPTRYIDLFMYITDNYEEALKIFEYIPRSHFKLFELLIKFLQIYLKCLVSCDSNLNSLIASALFKINRSKYGEVGDSVNKDYHQSQIANRLVKLFIENHTQFKTI